jgi:hypothetical protein
VALRPRLWPGVPLSRECSHELQDGTADVNTACGVLGSYVHHRTGAHR